MTTLKNRGKAGRDDAFFGTKAQQNTIKIALEDMCYLLTRGYAEKSALSLVGNRYRLSARQQKAIRGMSASTDQIHQRIAKDIGVSILKGKHIAIDGFNLLIILESALSGAYVFKGLDTCYRDLSSVHGTYKRIQHTETAIELIGKVLEKAEVASVLWLFDKPVSNSGRLKQLLLELAARNNYNWTIHLEYAPDKLLAESDAVVVTSDAWILDRVAQWCNLAKHIIENYVPQCNIIQSQ